jgi:CRISPR-associated protein Cas2
MMVLVLESVPVGLRGELTRWLIEPHPGVFVGHVSALVRDRLWLKCCEKLKDGGAVQLWSAPNEQRFAMRAYGATRREVADFEGLKLIRVPVEHGGE